MVCADIHIELDASLSKTTKCLLALLLRTPDHTHQMIYGINNDLSMELLHCAVNSSHIANPITQKYMTAKKAKITKKITTKACTIVRHNPRSRSRPTYSYTLPLLLRRTKNRDHSYSRSSYSSGVSFPASSSIVFPEALEVRRVCPKVPYAESLRGWSCFQTL